MPPVKLVVMGAGSRGTDYAQYAVGHPDEAQVVGVAEPREHYRNHLAERHGVGAGCVFEDWQQLANRPRFADAAIIVSIQHLEPVGFRHQANSYDRGNWRRGVGSSYDR